MQSFAFPQLFFICNCIALLMVPAQTQEPSGGTGRKLVWEDNFDGDSLDYSKWGIEVNAFGGGNGELQIFTVEKKMSVLLAGT